MRIKKKKLKVFVITIALIIISIPIIKSYSGILPVCISKFVRKNLVNIDKKIEIKIEIKTTLNEMNVHQLANNCES